MHHSRRLEASIDILSHSNSQAAGKPFVLRLWQRDIFKRKYGPTHDDGQRIARTEFITIEICGADAETLDVTRSHSDKLQRHPRDKPTSSRWSSMIDTSPRPENSQ